MKLEVLLLWFAFSTATKAGHGGPAGDEGAFKFTRKLYHSYVYENNDQAILPLQKEHHTSDLGNVFQGIAIPPWASLHKNRSRSGPASAVEIRSIRYKIVAGDGEFMFRSDVEIVGNFAFLRLKTRRNADNVLNREHVNRYLLTIRSAVKLYNLGGRDNNYSSGSSVTFNASSNRGDLYGGGGSARSPSLIATTSTTVKDETMVEIEVLDKNEMLPMFDNFTYEDITITDTTSLDKPLVRVTASDADHGRNAEIIYGFTKPEIGFDIDARTGDLFMTRNAFLIPNFIQGLREIPVQAVDRGVPQKTSFRNAIVKIYYLKKNVMEPIIRFVEERDVESLEKDVGKNSLFEDQLLATLSVFDGDSNGLEAHITYVGLGDYFLNGSLPSPFKLVPNFGQKCSRSSRQNTYETITSQSYFYPTYNWADKFDSCSSYKEYNVILSLKTLTAHVKAQNLSEASLDVITKYLSSPTYNVKDYGLEMNIMASDAGSPPKRSTEKIIFEKFNAFLLKHAKVQFRKGLYTTNITTMKPRNALITKFTATLNGLSVDECPIFEYRIGGGNQNGLFYIDPTTGALFVTNLKSTGQPNFYLVIEARLIPSHKFNYYTNRMPLKCRLFFGHLFKNVFSSHKVKPGTTALKIHVNRMEKLKKHEASSDMREHTVTANIVLDDHLPGYIRIPTADKLMKQITRNVLYELIFLKYTTSLDIGNYTRRSKDLTLNQVLTLNSRSGALVLNTKLLKHFLAESQSYSKDSIYYLLSPIDQTSDGIYRQNMTTSVIIQNRHYDPGNLIKDSICRRIKIVLLISTRFEENLRVESEIYNPKMHTVIRECDVSINDKNAIPPVFDAYQDLITNYFLDQNSSQVESCDNLHGSYGKGNCVDNSFMGNYVTPEKFVKAYAGLAFLTYDQPGLSQFGIHFDTGIISYNSDKMIGWQNTTLRIAVIDKHRWLILSFMDIILTNSRKHNNDHIGIFCKKRNPKQELSLTNPLEQRMIALKSRWNRFSLLHTWLRGIDASNPVLMNIEVPENFNSSGATIFKIPRNQITLVPGATERPDIITLIDELSQLDTVSFIFAVVGGNEQAHFDVDPTSGSVSLIRALDYEDRNNYSLNLEVSVTLVSDDNLALLFRSILNVYVLDVNDNAPYFVDMRGIPRQTYHFYLDLFPSLDDGIFVFKDRNVSIGRVMAQDLDGTNPYSKIRYIAKGGSELTVNRETGEVYYRVKWDHNTKDLTCGWNFNDILKYIQAMESQTMTYEVMANNEMTIINSTTALSESNYATIMVHVCLRQPMTLAPRPCLDIDNRLEDEEFYRRPIDVKIKPETPLFSVVAALPDPILSPRNDARILRYLEKCLKAGHISNNLSNYTASDVRCVKTYMWHDAEQMGDIERNVKHRHDKRGHHISHLFSNDYLLLDPFNGHLRLLARPSLLPNRMTFMLERGIICGEGKDMIGKFPSPLYFRMDSGSMDFVEISLSFYPTSQHRFPYPRLGEEMLTIANGSSFAPEPSDPLLALSLPPIPHNYESVPVLNELTPLVKAKNFDAEQDSTFPREAAVKYSLEYPDPAEIASLLHTSQDEVHPWKLFKINETSGAIYARNDADHFLSSTCTGIYPSDHWITLRATYLSQSKSTRVPVHFKVGGPKEPTYPFSLKPSYKVSIPENSPAYTPVAIIRASDTYTLSTALSCPPIHSSVKVVQNTLFDENVTFPLMALGGNLSETMAPTVSFALSGSDAKYFDINPLTGLLTTGEVVNVLTLDREKKSCYVVTVVMKLSTGPDTILGKCKVYIDLVDVNDNEPRFKKEYHTITIPISQFGSEAPIFTAFAIDKDTGMNAVVNYGFANDPTIGFNEEPNVIEIKGTKFRIQPTTGRVYMDSQAVQNEDTSYALQVRAFDTLQPDFSQDATYIVRSINALSNPTNKPEISPIYTISASESTKNGDIIMALEQHDPDGDGLRYWIDEMETEPGALETFAIDSDLNNVILVKPLDYETRTYYNLTIYVTDGTYLLSFKLYINVMDTNDNGPHFTKKLYRVKIYNTIPIGTKITTVLANDLDMDGHLKYTIYSYYTTTDKKCLGIDKSNGDVYVERPFDLEKSLVQLLVVKISDDSFNKPDFAHVLVVVQRDPSIPVLMFERDRYKINLNAPTSPGQGIIQLRLKDINHNSQPQTNHSAKFSIESGDVESLFGIHPTQGIVYFKRRPPQLMNTMPSVARHQLVIKASSEANKTLDLTLLDITLNYTNLNRSCGLGYVSSNSYALVIYDDIPPYTKIFENPLLQAMPTPARYHIESGNWNAYFYVDSLTGSLYTLAHAFQWCGHVDLDPVQMNGKKGCEKNLTIKVALNPTAQDEQSFECADFYKPNDMSKTVYTLNIHLRPNPRKIVKPKAIEASVAGVVVGPTISITYANNSVKIYEKIVRRIYLPAYPSTVIYQTSKTYSLQMVSNNKTYYSLDPKTGVLILNSLITEPQRVGIELTTIDADETLSLDVHYEELETGKDFAFTYPTYSASIEENISLRGLSLAQVSSLWTYQSLSYNPTTTTYTIVNDPDNNFKIDPKSGIVFADNLERFDWEKQSSYLLVIQANSSCMLQNAIAQSKLQIKVIDLNDNAPKFLSNFSSTPIYNVTYDDEDHSVILSCALDVHIGVNTSWSESMVITKLIATDFDSLGANSETMYDITNVGSDMGIDIQPYFDINPNTGELFIKGNFSKLFGANNLLLPTITLQVKATDGGNSSLASSVALMLNFIRDHNRPRSLQFYHSFSHIKPFYEIIVAENVTAPSIIASFTPENGDDITHVSYLMDCPEKMCDVFGLDLTHGFLAVIGRLHYEEESFYQGSINIIDQISGNSLNTKITVKILDVNDNYPVFDRSHYTISLFENIRVGSLIFNVSATDLDADENGLIKYSIKCKNDVTHKCPFVLPNSKKGEIYLGELLDYEIEQIYQLEIIATDCGNPPLSSKAKISVIIVDVNDNSPVFLTNFNDNLTLDLPVQSGYVTYQFFAEDKDSALCQEELTYSIVAGDEFEFFDLGNTTGILRTARILSAPQQFILNVSVHDGLFYAFSTLIINAKPHHRINENLSNSVIDNLYPEYDNIYSNNIESHQEFYLTEDGRIGTLVGQVTLPEFMVDQMDSQRYNEIGDKRYLFELLNENKIGRAFRIKPHNGKIHINVPLLSYTQKQAYALSILVTDQWLNKKHVVIVTIKIIEIPKSRPNFIAKYYDRDLYLNEISPINKTLLKIDMEPKINTSSLEFSILKPNTTKAYAIIESTSGKIWLKRSFWTYYNQFYKSRATEIDPNLSNSVDTNHASPVPSGAKLDFIVRARDKRDLRLYSDIPVTLRIHNTINDAELKLTDLFNETYQFTIPESTPPGSIVGQIGPTRNLTNSFNYNFLIVPSYDENSSDRNIFTIDSDGNIYLTPNGTESDLLNRENGNQRVFMVEIKLFSEAKQQNIKLLTKVIIQFVSTNIDFPQFDCRGTGRMCQIVKLKEDFIRAFKPSIHRDLFPSIPITIVRATHANSIGTFNIKYGIVETTTIYNSEMTKLKNSMTLMNTERLFKIDTDTGWITVNSQIYNGTNLLDYFDKERIDSYILNISATLGATSYTQYMIKILDVNDNAPYLDPTQPHFNLTAKGDFSVDINEGPLIGPEKCIMTIRALDMDVDDSLRYFIVSGNEKRHFMINNLGRLCLTLDGGLDKETLDEYTLLVNISDSQHTISSKVKINVMDINDNAPICPEPQKITIPENIPNASFIVMIDAQDKDATSKGKLVYTFARPESYNYFDISDSKGIIYTVVNMDREVRSTYEIGVRVEDEGGLTCSTTIEITLSDVNDNAPTFEHPSYVLNLLPSLKIGSPIAQIRARDPDTGLNQKIRYSISNAMEGELPFSIDDSSGIIKLLSGSRDKTLYRFKVIARDSGTPELETAANVVISISDNNDTLDVINLSLSLNVSANSSVNSTVATIPDLLPNINFAHYTIVSGNEENYFRISNYSGDVILNKHLNSGRNKDAYEIDVLIADDTKNMNTKEMSNLKLFINVIPFTDNITNISLKTCETCVNSTLSIDLTSEVSTTQATFIPFIEFGPKNESYTVSNVVYLENTTIFPSSLSPEVYTVNFSETPTFKDISTRNEKSIPEVAILDVDEIQELPYKINNPDDECCGILFDEPHCHAHKLTNQSNSTRSQGQKYKLLILPIISRHHDKGNRSDSLDMNDDDLIYLDGNAGESYAKFVLKKWPTPKKTSDISNQHLGTPLHVKFYMKYHNSHHKPGIIFTIKFIKILDKSQYALSLEMVGGNMLRIRVSTLIAKHSNSSTIFQDDHYTEEEEAIVGLHNPNAVTTEWYLVAVMADDMCKDKIQITWSPVSSLSDLSPSLIQRGRIIPLPDIFSNFGNQTVEFLVGKDLSKGDADGFSGCLASFELNGWSPFRRNESKRLAIKNENTLIKRRKLVNIDFICKSSVSNKSLETLEETSAATCGELYHKPSVQKGIDERTKIVASCLKSSHQCKNFCKTVKKLCNPSKSCPDLVLVENLGVHDDYCAYLLPHKRANHRDYSIDWSDKANVSLTNNSTPNKDGKYDPISPTQMLHSVKLFFCFPILALLLATFVLVGVKCMFCPSAHRRQKVKARMYNRGGAVTGSRYKKGSANGQHLVATKYGKLTIKYRSKSPDKNGEIALNDTQNVTCKLLQALDTRDGVDPNKAKQAQTAINSSADPCKIQCKGERRSRFAWLKRSKNKRFSNVRKTTQQELTPLNNTIIRNVLSTAPNIGTETGHVVSTVSTFVPSNTKNYKEPATTSHMQSGQMRRLAQQHKKRKCNKHGTTVDDLSPDHHKLLLDVTSNELKRISKLSNFEADTSPNSQDPFGQSFYVNQPFYSTEGGSGTYAENSSEVINLQRKISKMSNELQAALHGSKGIKEENIFKPSPLPKHTKFLVTKEYKISNIERENSLRTNAVMGPSLNSRYVSPRKQKSRQQDSWLACTHLSHESHSHNFNRLAPNLEGYNVKITRPLSFHQQDRGTSLQQERLDTLLSAPTISNSEKDDHSFTELLSLLRSRSSDKSYINRGSNKRIASQDIRLSDENVALLSNDPCNKCNENEEQSDAFGFPKSGYDPYDAYQFGGGIKQPLQSNYVNYPVLRPPLPFNASPKTSSKMGRKHRGFYDEYRFRSLTSLENESTLEWSQEADIFDIVPNQIFRDSKDLCANDGDTNNLDPYIFNPSLTPVVTDYIKCSPISMETIPPQNSAVYQAYTSPQPKICDKESGNDDIISPIEPPLTNQITLQPVPNFQMHEGTKGGGKKRKKKMLLQTQV